jgi:hypothetical protein
MTTSQSPANIAQARQSTGPATDAGKPHTRLNAYRHGLTGQVCIFSAEERAAFDHHCDGIRAALAPVGALELDLAQSIAEDRWRLKRARAIESGIFALGQCREVENAGDPGQAQINEALSQARTWLTEGENIQLLAVYEQRIHSAVEKNMAELRTLRAERQAIRQKALEEAQLLAQLAYFKGKTYDPATDFPAQILKQGPDFSTAGINRVLLRNRRLREAGYRAGQNWKPGKRYPQIGVPIPATPNV